jgi:hypothetical protein
LLGASPSEIVGAPHRVEVCLASDRALQRSR